MEHLREYLWAYIAGILTLIQIVLSFFFYSEVGTEALRYIGYLFWLISAILGWLPILTLRKKGNVPRGRSYIHTRVLVTSGIYSIVRHPQFLAWYFINLALILITQHWLIAILGILSMATAHRDMGRADEDCIEKFGDAYNQYVQRVPGLNLPLGILLWIQRRMVID